MLQTLFYVPIWLFESPWMWVWTAILVLAGVAHGAKKGWVDATSVWAPPLVLLWAFAYFLIGEIVDYGIDPESPTQVVPLGIAVRGYGVMMLLGIVAGVILAIHRGQAEGLSADHVFSLALHLVIFGIVGARLFYVIQYWDSFAVEPMPHRLVSMINMTKGGLVVLGSFFGGIVGMLYWSRRQGIRFLKLADLVGPSFLIGLSLGRIGCFFNGCCFGGYCEIPQVGVHFPAGSAPYVRQLEMASLLGIQTTTDPNEQTAKDEELNPDQGDDWRTVTSVPANSVGAKLGLAAGDRIQVQFLRHSDSRIGADTILRAGVNGVDLPPAVIIERQGSDNIEIPWDELPKSARPIHPTQIYSSINALVLALIVGFSYRFRRFDGQSFVYLLVLYGVTRFVIEWIRVDEPGQFGTDLSISQWGCIGLVVCGVALAVYGFSSGKKSEMGTVKA